MIVDRFLQWSDSAPTQRRVEAADALARAYLYSRVDEADRRKILHGLFRLVDDRSCDVRARLADVFADRRDAPKPLVLRLLDDVPAVCAALYARSPLLLQRHLLDGLERGDDRIAVAIAERLDISAKIVSALIDHAPVEACNALVSNSSADFTNAMIERYIARFAGDPGALDHLQSVRTLDVTAQCKLVMAHAKALQGNSFVQAMVADTRLARMTGLAGERAVLGVMAGLPGADIWRSLDSLYDAGFVTPALILRAAFCGHMSVLEAVVGHLASASSDRVRSAFVHPRPAVVSALLKKTGLRPSVQEVLAMSLVLARELAAVDVSWSDGFFAEALLEVLDHRLAHDARQGVAAGFGSATNSFDDDVAALCQDIASDIIQNDIREDLARVLTAPHSAAPAALSAPVAMPDRADELDDSILIDVDMAIDMERLVAERQRAA